MNTTHSDPDSRWEPVPGNGPVEPVAIDLGHLTGADLETALATAAWVIALCEQRPERARSGRTVRFDLGVDRGVGPSAPSFGHS